MGGSQICTEYLTSATAVSQQKTVFLDQISQQWGNKEGPLDFGKARQGWLKFPAGES